MKSERFSFPPSRHFPLPLTIFLAALVVKLLVFFLATDPIVFFKYPFFAKQLDQGIDIGERLLDLSPFYLYLNLLFYKIYGENWEALALIQIILGSLNCLFVYAVGEKLFNRTIGLLAALILLAYGNLTLIELTLEPETFVLFFNSLFVLTLISALNRAESRFRSFPWLLVGLTAGLSLITKPNGLFLLPLALVGIGWAPFPWGPKIKAALVLLVGAGLVLSPIAVRNHLTFHDLVLVTADGGKVFFHGNGPGGTGIERADLPGQGFLEEGRNEPDYAHALFRQVARSATGRHLSPSECSRYWVFQAWDYMKHNPLSSSLRMAKKFLLFWGNYEIHDIDSTFNAYTKIRAFPLVPFGLIALPGLAGLFLTARNYRRLWPLHGMVAVYALSVLIFFPASRYRLPAAPFLAIFAAAFWVFLFGSFRGKQWGKVSLMLGGILLLAAGIHWPLRQEIADFDRWQIATRIHYNLLGNDLFRKGRFPEAVEEYRKAIHLEPGFPMAYNRLGMAYAHLNDLENAEQNFLRVIQIAPRSDQGYANLGFLYLLKGDPDRAVPLLEKALILNPGNARARQQLQLLREKRK